mmetsp:Transcript_9655/g.39345  ORF Transcript_9655/g.39345 Transcript_9655/m.39345 type:complete len:364 (+) Transcript_9655:338-1429(+)
MALTSSLGNAAWELHNLRTAAYEQEYGSLASLIPAVEDSEYVLELEWSSDESGDESIVDRLRDDESENSDGEVADTYLYRRTSETSEDAPKPFELLLRLGQTTTLTKEEELEQTKEHYGKLVNLYGAQFRRLHDVLKNKHRRFLKQHKKLAKVSGTPAAPSSVVTSVKSPAKQLNLQRKLRDHKRKRPAMKQYEKLKQAKKVTTPMRQDRARRKADIESRARVKQKEAKQPRMPEVDCCVERCTMRAMRPSAYCYAHVTSDPDQLLFQGCQFPNETGDLCNYPILITRDPPICNGHIDLLTQDGKRTDLRMTKKEKREREEDAKIKKVTFSNAKSYSVNKCYERIIDLLIEVQTKRRNILKAA